MTPNNPTGAVYPPALIESFFELARDRGLALVIDETYREFREHSDPPHRLFTRPDWSDTLIHLYSFSKAYCMAGYRIGCMATNPALLRETLKIADCVALCPSHIGQLAATFCLEHLDDWKRARVPPHRPRPRRLRRPPPPRSEHRLRSRLLRRLLRLPPPPLHRPHLRLEVGRSLAEDHGILCLAGSMFGPGQDHYLRLAFANVDLPAIDELVARLVRIR